MSRLRSEMSFDEQRAALADGNLGAMHVVSMLDESYFLVLDDLGIGGYDLHLLFIEVCEHDINRLKALLIVAHQGVLNLIKLG